MTFKLRAPNPDTNGVKIEGYDRVQRSEDGLFHVNDSNHADKLKAAPWFFEAVADAPVARKAAPKLPEEKTLEEMNREELVAWLAERGTTDVKEDDTVEILLPVAQTLRDKAKSNKKK